MMLERNERNTGRYNRRHVAVCSDTFDYRVIKYPESYLVINNHYSKGYSYNH
jgi:hypothetical protein